jgi:hypothetical protein
MLKRPVILLVTSSGFALGMIFFVHHNQRLDREVSVVQDYRYLINGGDYDVIAEDERRS